MTTPMTQITDNMSDKQSFPPAVRQIAVQSMKILSSHENRIKVLASTNSSVGFSPDGEVMMQYTAAAHMTHELHENPIVDLNHHQDEVIGRIVSSEATLEGNLIVEFEIEPKYGFFVPIVKNELHDGVSIEGIVTSGRWVDEHTFIIGTYILTGIAVLFTKPPACDKEICNVLSADRSPSEFYDIYSKVAEVNEDDPAELENTLLAISNEILKAESSSCSCDSNGFGYGMSLDANTNYYDTTTMNGSEINIDTRDYSGTGIDINTTKPLPSVESCGGTCGSRKLSLEDLYSMKELVEKRIAELNNTTNDSGDTMTDEIVDNHAEAAVAVEAEAETPEPVEAVAEATETVEAVVESAEAEAEAEAPAEEVVAEVATEDTVEAVEAPAEPEAPVEVEAEMEAEAEAEAPATPEPVEAPEMVPQAEYDSMVAERDQLLTAVSNLKEQLLAGFDEKAVGAEVLSNAAKFVEGYDPSTPLADQDGTVVAKVVAFSSIAAPVASDNAGADEVIRKGGKAPEKTERGNISFPGLTGAAEWARRQERKHNE